MMSNNNPAAGPWRTDQAPKDGGSILAIFYGVASVVFWWDSEDGWHSLLDGKRIRQEPSAWAEIYMPAAQAEEGER